MSAIPGDIRLFVSYVSTKTGLSPTVVTAWYLAEGGPSDNPLNIGPGHHYNGPYGAARATVELLQSPRYAAIRRAAHGTDTQQIAAIAASPWDANHYRGKGGSVGALLRGTYLRVKGLPGSTGGVIGAAGRAGNTIAGAEQGAANALTNPLGWISDVEHWAEGAALRALAYIVLTVAAIALFVLGLERTLGPTPLTRGLPTGINPVTARIPF